MEPNPNLLFQIIQEDGEFAAKEDVEKVVRENKINDLGFNYYVVAVLGCQSGGKSTLLNLLFGTQFPVMEAQKGRQQTTKGVWMGLSRTQSTLLIFDVEGTDSRERGDSHANFEQKTSLFSLALAEVLIINMWQYDIGRYNAGNLPLLRTVFELNLQLFQQSRGTTPTHKTLILFVIRDHAASETPLENLKKTIIEDMQEIWKNLIKPKGFENSSVFDFFDFQYTSLPHKVHQSDLFNSQVKELRRRFIDPSSPDYLISQTYRKDIPSDGFMAFANGIWSIIKENKDLNLPSQKEMLAKYRCEEISSEIFVKFAENFQPIKAQLAKGEIVSNFGQKSDELLKEAMDTYAVPASRYLPDVAKKAGEALQTKIIGEIHTSFLKQTKLISQKTLADFNASVKLAMPDNGPSVEDFSNTIKGIYDTSIEFFESTVKNSIISAAAETWSFEEEHKELVDNLKNRITQLKQTQLEKLMKESRIKCNTELSRSLERLLDNPNEEMWGKIRNIYNQTKQTTMNQLSRRLKGYEISNEEIEQKEKAFEDLIFQVLKDKFLEKAKYVQFLMSKKFDNVFNIDVNGFPRRWKPKDDVGTIFSEAKQKATFILEQFTFLRLIPEHDTIEYLNDDSKVESELIILSFEECRNILEKFEMDSKTAYLQAIRDQETLATSAHVPVWILLLVFILGFNEFIHVLTSPILLILFVLLGIVLYGVYFFGLGGPTFKMAINMMQLSINQARQLILDQYDQHQHQTNNNNINNNSTSSSTPPSTPPLTPPSTPSSTSTPGAQSSQSSKKDD